ncbi:hypothetical protein D3C84_1057950 [compost metagenome]
MRGEVAQVAERANPALEDFPVVHAVLGGDTLLIGYFHHGQQLGNSAKVPDLDRHPKR